MFNANGTITLYSLSNINYVFKVILYQFFIKFFIWNSFATRKPFYILVHVCVWKGIFIILGEGGGENLYFSFVHAIKFPNYGKRCTFFTQTRWISVSSNSSSLVKCWIRIATQHLKRMRINEGSLWTVEYTCNYNF